MNETKTYLSKEKHKELVNELDFLTSTKRGEIAEQLQTAKEFGDLSENAEYHEARELQAITEDRIRTLEALLKNVEIVEHKKSDSVSMGAIVTVQKKGNDEPKTLEIVGSEEADMKALKISLNSPLGQAMLGKKKGETFTFTTPAGKEFEYTILKID